MKQQTISFDFDGVLHKSVNRFCNPIYAYDFEYMIPFKEIHSIINEYKKQNYNVVITSARSEKSRNTIESFIVKYNLPIDSIYLTNRNTKVPVLKENKVIKHYDDRNMFLELIGTGVKFVHVKPFNNQFIKDYNGLDYVKYLVGKFKS